MKLKLNSIKYGKEGMKIEYDKVFNYFKDKITEVEEGYFIEINTLEELTKLFELAEENLIIWKDVWGENEEGLEISIYDDYIE